MRKTGTSFLLFLIVGLLSVPNAQSKGGTLLLGAKGWVAFWDSSLEEAIHANGLPDAVAEAGKGYLAGPLLGYQTSDGKWSFSTAFMVVSSFTQKITEPTLAYDIDVKRTEFDYSISRSLSDHFKLFVGLKISQLKNDLTMTGIPGTDKDGFGGTYALKLDITAPSFGLGYTTRLSDRFVLGLQLGGIYAIKKWKSPNPAPGIVSNFVDNKLANDLGANVEADVNILISDKVIAQVGYRLQTFKVKEAEGSKATYPQPSSTDVFQGVILSLVYSFAFGGY